MATKIYGMGNPLLDISADVDMAFLDKYELKPANAVLAEPDKHKTLYEELAAKSDVQYIPGGATLNSIRVSQWMLPAGMTSYTGCIGTDEFGDRMVKQCEAEGLNVPFMRISDTPTGTCGVMITGKERSLCANLAAANNFKEEHLDTPEVKAAIEGAGIYYSAGFFLTVSPPALMKVAKHACENNKIVCLNLSAPFIIQFFGGPLAEVLPYVDFVFCNEDEAGTYAEVNKLGTTDLAEIAKKIVAIEKVNTKRPRHVVFTHGKDPTVVATPEGSTEYPVPAIEADKIVDTNGAGDAFVGGFLSQLALGKDIKTCCDAGHYAAGVIIQHSGCTFPEGGPKF